MILELKKSCIETIERALLNINNIRMQWSSSFPKPAQQKLNSVQNDIQLLKDNFTLIISKVLRLESKCNQKQSMALKIQHKYRVKFEQSCEAYKILEVKHQKLGKQLNFIKFSNNCLRSEIHSLQNNKGTNTKFKKVIREIQKLISNNGQNLQNNVRKLIASVQKDFDQDNNQEQGQFNAENEIKIELPNHNNRVRSVSQFSLEHPVIKQQMPLKQQNMIINSCQLKAQKDQRTKKKPSSINKQSSQLHETASTEKKKRSQLAKLVEQQSRLARINQRYLSTDIY